MRRSGGPAALVSLAGGTAEVPTEVWVDGDYDFGADADVEPPPRDRVLNMDQLAGAGVGS